MIVFRTGKCAGELTGKQRDKEMNRPDLEIHDDTLFLAADRNFCPPEGLVERYNMKFDKR